MRELTGVGEIQTAESLGACNLKVKGNESTHEKKPEGVPSRVTKCSVDRIAGVVLACSVSRAREVQKFS